MERSKEVAAETEDEEVSVTIQEHIERSKEVKEEPVMMIGKAGNTVTESVKELERDPGDVETKENDLAETTVETTTPGHANAWRKEEKEVPVERGKEVTEEPAMMIGKAGNTVTEHVKVLERDLDDVAKKENAPPNGGSCGKSGASLKTASKKVLLLEIEAGRLRMERDKKTPHNVERDKVPGNEPEEKAKDVPMCDKQIAHDRAKNSLMALGLISRAKTALVFMGDAAVPSRRHAVEAAGDRSPCERRKMPEATLSLQRTAALIVEQVVPQAGTSEPAAILHVPQRASPMPTR